MENCTEKHICITRAGQERHLCTELLALGGPVECTDLELSVVELSGVSAATFEAFPLFFSRQLLPNAQALSASSIKTWATAITQKLIEQLGESTTAWRLHIFDPATADTGERYARPRLIQQEVLAILKQKRRSLLKTLVDERGGEGTLVQVVTFSPTGGFISFADQKLCSTLSPTISPEVAGYVNIPDDRTPPSRAFKKLREAITVFGLSFKRGMHCVDLGACPGGWAHVLLEHECRVTAIDRTPLDPPLMRNRDLIFVQGDAFTWAPEKPVDWMVCDVITSPDRTVELLKRWLEGKLCRSFCVTVKFKGDPDFNALRELRELLAQGCSWFSMKQLTNNKNELTVVGRAAK